MRIVVTGGRDFKDRCIIHGCLDYIHSLKTITAIRHGNANGVDKICGEWARINHIVEEICEPDWDDISKPDAIIKETSSGKKYNAKAGHDRNQSMLDQLPKPDLCVPFPGGAGTKDMLKRMHKSGIPVYEVINNVRIR